LFPYVDNLPVVERWFGVLNTFYFCIAAGYGSMGQPIKSAGIMMTTLLQKVQLKRNNVLKKINVEGNMDERQEVMVCCETAALKWKEFESQMVIWRKMYQT